MKRLNNNGDTIVEVLIAITIVGLVLFGAYQSVNRSTRAIQDTQEHNQALKLAENQLEYLRLTGDFPVTDPGKKDCFDPSPTVSAPMPVIGIQCQLEPNGTGGVQYTVAIGKEGTCYYASVDWDTLLNGHAQIKLAYHPLELN